MAETTELLKEAIDVGESEEQVKAEVFVPSRNDTGWSDYLLMQFSEDEVVIKRDSNKNEIGRFPKVNGLRRLARIHNGEIVKSYPSPVVTVYHPTEEYVVACYQYTIIFEGGKEFSDVGEVIFAPRTVFSNIDEKFGKFPSSVAVTRAEARALRKSLGLNVVSADELNMSDLSGQSVTYLTEMQKFGIENFAQKAGINLSKYISSGEYAYNDINKIQFSDAAKMWKELESFQRDKAALMKCIAKYNVGV